MAQILRQVWAEAEVADRGKPETWTAAATRIKELNTGGHQVTRKRLAEAATESVEIQRMDWRLHQQMAGLPLAAPVPDEDWSADGDPWVPLLDDWREDLLVVNPEEWGFADGSRDPKRGTVGAAAVYIKPAVTPGGERDWDGEGEVVR